MFEHLHIEAEHLFTLAPEIRPCCQEETVCYNRFAARLTLCITCMKKRVESAVITDLLELKDGR